MRAPSTLGSVPISWLAYRSRAELTCLPSMTHCSVALLRAKVLTCLRNLLLVQGTDFQPPNHWDRLWPAATHRIRCFNAPLELSALRRSALAARASGRSHRNRIRQGYQSEDRAPEPEDFALDRSITKRTKHGCR